MGSPPVKQICHAGFDAPMLSGKGTTDAAGILYQVSAFSSSASLSGSVPIPDRKEPRVGSASVTRKLCWFRSGREGEEPVDFEASRRDPRARRAPRTTLPSDRSHSTNAG